MAEISSAHKSSGCRDNVKYVPHCGAGVSQQHLANLALQDIPKELEEYFRGKNIHPDPVDVKDEIAVLPYSPATDFEVPMETNAATGEW